MTTMTSIPEAAAPVLVKHRARYLDRARTLSARLWLPVGPEETFGFFSDARNLARITPGWMHFRILTPGPIEMRPGTVIDYSIRVRGLPLRWRTEITAFDPPHRFVDEQVRGPYRLWHHVHTFEPKDGGTLVGDTVTYATPLGATRLGRVIHDRVIRPDLDRIFAHRGLALRNLLGREGERRPPGLA